eukprot:5118500-Pleurochrysis_carterae.AAC.2
MDGRSAFWYMCTAGGANVRACTKVHWFSVCQAGRASARVRGRAWEEMCSDGGVRARAHTGTCKKNVYSEPFRLQRAKLPRCARGVAC